MRSDVFSAYRARAGGANTGMPGRRPLKRLTNSNPGDDGSQGGHLGSDESTGRKEHNGRAFGQTHVRNPCVIVFFELCSKSDVGHIGRDGTVCPTMSLQFGQVVFEFRPRMQYDPGFGTVHRRFFGNGDGVPYFHLINNAATGRTHPASETWPESSASPSSARDSCDIGDCPQQMTR